MNTQTPAITISSSELNQLSRWMESASGVHLDSNKAYLFESRLQDLLTEYKLQSFTQLHERVRSAPNSEIGKKTLELLLTRETSFFRDTIPFDLLRNKIIPGYVSNSRAGFLKLKIWCAACSTGQEVYSVAMAVSDVLGASSSHDIRILGTDISDDAIAKASYGEYSDLEIARGMDPMRLSRYFVKTANGFRISDPVRAMVSFTKLNLLEDFMHLGRYDIIFCRNIAIYFRPETRGALFGRLAESLTEKGILVVGASEMLHGLEKVLSRNMEQKAVYYQKLPTPGNFPILCKPL
ncbi:MAG: chemotaxis protein CheR [Candidatus Wallbacteria bacterium HGW-Wallbacteria-1]|jgi:chemotaxis protein methyltransferase CheR|uniref:protein-glutamate O-methyltransferase n=1 Tax=Candidatus Wallbacteria bacterium HGW-Wallbacteria-1 TaxID=2013854 RepID=A0A2N1PKV0_9BACT|nr:MAG: chemotaxis protein CheR [Candidatus Wallbacteria bacterium HGW-Wallbacteria-1]